MAHGPPATSPLPRSGEGRGLSVSVVICVYQEPLEWLAACLAPLVEQAGPGTDLLVLDQRGRLEIQDHIRSLQTSGVPLACVAIEDRSIAHARNVGLDLARGDLVAFLDPDIVPRPGWLRAVQDAFAGTERPAVMAGRILPLYEGAPRFLSRAPIVRETQSILDLGETAQLVDRAIAGNLAVRRSAVGTLRFNEDLGRKDGLLLGGEETDFCERVLEAGGQVLYWPDATVLHRIPQARMRLRWLVRRFYFGGLSRGLRGGPPRPIDQRRSWRDVAAMVVLGGPYAIGLLRGRRARLRRVQG